MSLRVLTGIKPTGVPHLGNYAGAIRPAVAASRAQGVESFFFLADYHALISTQDPLRVQRSTLEIAASWLACGLDPERVAFYRQSDIPEIPELTWLLTCVSAKGLLNRAHAYKAAVDRNVEAGEDPDAGVTMGLYSYPVLMAADILMFNAHKIPVGRDQVQHVEMARDIGQRFNHLFGNGREFFVLPEAVIEENVATLPGLDGRKMSKSYDNTIPLFAPREELRRLVFSILTDSRLPGEAKDTEGSALFQLYQAFADGDETAAMRSAYAEGIAWGEAKERVFERIDAELAPLRERYRELAADPAAIERMLRQGGERLRDEEARPFLAQLRSAVGLRDLATVRGEADADVGTGAEKLAPPQFKQYREDDGRFHFKLVDGDVLLLQGAGFESPREAGRIVALLKSGAAAPRVDAGGRVWLDDADVGALGETVDADALLAALERFAGDAA